MKVLDIKSLQLGLSVGLVIGLLSLVLGYWLGVNWWLKSWRLIRELFGLGLGVIYVVNCPLEVIRTELKLLIAKFGLFVYWVIIVWLVWLLLVWVAAGGTFIQDNIKDVPDLFSYGHESGWLEWLLSGVVQSVKMIGLGLLPILAWRWLQRPNLKRM